MKPFVVLFFQIDARNERFKCLNQHLGVIGNVRTFDGVKLFLPGRLPQDVSSHLNSHKIDGSIWIFLK